MALFLPLVVKWACRATCAVSWPTCLTLPSKGRWSTSQASYLVPLNTFTFKADWEHDACPPWPNHEIPNIPDALDLIFQLYFTEKHEPDAWSRSHPYGSCKILIAVINCRGSSTCKTDVGRGGVWKWHLSSDRKHFQHRGWDNEDAPLKIYNKLGRSEYHMNDKLFRGEKY